MDNKQTRFKGSNLKANANNPSNTVANLNGAAVVDENGNEIPITEQMIQMACTKLICDWESSLNSNH